MKDTLPTRVRFGAFELDLKSGELHNGDQIIQLQDQPFKILRILIERGGEIATREQIQKKLWPNNTVVEFDHSINAAIKNLRRVLGDSAAAPQYVETVGRHGYRFMVPVEWVPERPADAKPADFETGSQLQAPSGANLTGKRISHYRVLEILGGGGMGVVYKAEDTRLGRSVAIKFLTEELSDDLQALERFQREARAASALNHPNICTVHEVGEYEDVPFIVMEYVTGKSLDQLIGTEGLPVNSVLNYAIQITDALVKAHSAGIVHRDLKPANIMVNQDGLVKLLDFGLAKVRSVGPIAGLPTPARTPPLTREGAILGTLQYMAPEQLEGREVDARMDIFALGAVFYEMATGRKAFEGKSHANQIAAILEREPPLVSSACRLATPTLDRVVATCLAKNPDDRWQTAGDLLRELKCLAEGRDQPPGVPARRRNWLVLTLAVIATVAALAVTGFGVYRLLSLRPKLSVETVHFAKLTDNGAAEVAAISPDGRYVTYTVRQAEKVGLWLRQITGQGGVESGVESGVGILPPDALGIWGLTFSPDGNYIYFLREVRNDPNFRNLYMMPALGGHAQLLITDVDSPVSFSPDGREFVFERNLNLSGGGIELRIANVNGSGDRLLTTFRNGEAVYHPGPSWSPDGRTIAVPVLLKVRGWKLVLVSVAGGSVREVWSNSVPIGHPVWLPGGDTLLLPLVNQESSRGELWTISVPGGKGRRFTNDLTDYSPYLDITRDGRMVAATASTWFFNIWAFQAADLTKGRQITSGELPMLDVVEIPDGRLVSISQGGSVWVVRADGSDRRLLTAIRGREPLDSCGKFVVFGSDIDVLNRVDADGVSTPIRVGGGLTIAACTPDGRSIFYVTEKRPQKIMRLPVEGGRPAEIAEVRGEITNGRLAISPDGQFIAYVSVEGSPGLWIAHVIRIVGGLPVKTFKVPGSLRVRKLSWSPSGQGLQYLVMRDSTMNIWEQPLDGEEQHQVTHFTSGLIFSFFWSSDHKQLLMTRGSISNNVVLVDFRPDEHK